MMNKYLYILLLFPFTVIADNPELSSANGEYQLSIPYFTFKDKAYSVDLFTSEDNDDLVFYVDLESLMATELDEEEEISLDEDAGACTNTANVAFMACSAEVEDDYFIAFGNCLNLGNSLIQSTCKQSLTSIIEEADEECEDQYEARIQVCAAVGEAPYDPVMDPANFMSKEQIIAEPNDYFPLVPGNEWVYEAEDETVTVTVTDETREILGITAIVVRDVVSEEDELIEDTDDWFAQDLQGNIWYMGEISKNYEDGRLVDVEGSWEAGVDGAKAGILIRALPVIDETTRQEFLLGKAEDMGQTLSVTAEGESGIEADIRCNENCLLMLEYTPLEPDTFEHKIYYPGIGKILSIDLEEGEEEALVSYTLQ